MLSCEPCFIIKYKVILFTVMCQFDQIKISNKKIKTSESTNHKGAARHTRIPIDALVKAYESKYKLR